MGRKAPGFGYDPSGGNDGEQAIVNAPIVGHSRVPGLESSIERENRMNRDQVGLSRLVIMVLKAI